MIMLNLFFDKVIFPKKCVGCGKFGDYFCDGCIGRIYQTDLVCPECERPSIGGATHPLCKRRFSLDGLWSLGIYQPPLKIAIQKLKYRFVSELSETLINLVINYWSKFSPQLLEKIKQSRGEGWVIVPVPLHPKRENWRGFNQSALLGKDLAEKLGLKYGEYLKRVKETKPQAQLVSFYRKQNIKGAFALDSRPQRLDSNIILIDDVWTTGSTLKECAKVLKGSGASSVWALTLAR